MKISSFATLLTGIAIGTIVGLLIAPDEGARTRKKLIKKGKKYKKEIEAKATKLKDKAAGFKDDITGAAHDIQKRFT